MRLPLIMIALLALGACSKDKEIEPPAELTEFSASLKVQRAWDAGVGGEKSPLRLGLALTVVGERVYAAGRDGDVAAFEVATGKPLWRSHVKARLAGGPGAGDSLVAVGTSDGQAIGFNASDGAVRWTVTVGGEVLNAPAVGANIVVVRTVDGRLRGLSPEDGHELWFYEQTPVPPLSLRGTSRPIIVGDVVLCGFDNGKVVAVNATDGSLVWEATVAPSHGRTELEKLVDIDSAVVVEGANVYVVGFQGRVAMLALDSGQVWWSHEASSYRGLGMDDESLYYSTAAGEVVALRKRTGVELWRQEVLKNRTLSAPTTQGNSVAVADYEGYVHWLDKATGTLVARTSSGGKRVSNPPVEASGLLLVINDVGHITAFRQVEGTGKETPAVATPAAETAPAAAAPAAAAPAEPAVTATPPPAEPAPAEAPPAAPAAPVEPETPPPPQ